MLYFSIDTKTTETERQTRHGCSESDSTWCESSSRSLPSSSFFFSFSFIREPSPEVLRRWEWRCKNRCPAPGTCFVCVFLSHSRAIKMGKHVCSTGNSIRGLQAPGAYCTLLLSSCFDHEMKKKKRKRKKKPVAHRVYIRWPWRRDLLCVAIQRRTTADSLSNIWSLCISFHHSSSLLSWILLFTRRYQQRTLLSVGCNTRPSDENRRE